MARRVREARCKPLTLVQSSPAATTLSRCSCVALQAIVEAIRSVTGGRFRPIADIGAATHRSYMSRNALLARVLVVSLAGCEPLRGVVSEKETPTPVSVDCVDAALRKAFGKVERWDYVSDGSNSFTTGTKVAQFAYYQSDDARTWTTLELANGGKVTRLAHSFTGAGCKIPEDDFPPAFRMMRKATLALQSACGLNLADMRLEAVGQHVEALERQSVNGS